MNYLSKDDILAVQDVQYEDVEVPEWGGTVRVKSMTGTERDDFEGSMIKGKGKSASVNLSNLRAKLVARSVVDGANKRIFSDEDITELGKKNSAALNRVYEVAQRLSGISPEDVDELTKNSETVQSEEPGSK